MAPAFAVDCSTVVLAGVSVTLLLLVVAAAAVSPLTSWLWRAGRTRPLELVVCSVRVLFQGAWPMSLSAVGLELAGAAGARAGPALAVATEAAAAICSRNAASRLFLR